MKNSSKLFTLFSFCTALAGAVVLSGCGAIAGATINNKGVNSYTSGEQFDALDYYNEAIAKASNSARIYNNRGLTNYLVGNHSGALGDFNQSISLNPKYFKAHNNRGTMFFILGDDERALEDLNRTTVLNHKLEEQYFNRGLLYLSHGNYRMARRNIDLALQYFGDDDNYGDWPEAMYLKAMTYEIQGEWTEANEFYGYAKQLRVASYGEDPNIDSFQPAKPEVESRHLGLH